MKDENCIFCKIANGEIPSATIYEDELFRAIMDLNPASRGHALVLPKKHFADAVELDEQEAAKILPVSAKLGKAMKAALGSSGFHLLQNNGTSAGQTVFHYHMHVIPTYEETKAAVSFQAHSADSEELQKTAQTITDYL